MAMEEGYMKLGGGEGEGEGERETVGEEVGLPV